MVFRTDLRGVVVPAFSAVSAWMMCQPNWVFTGWESSPTFSAKATLSNSGTVWPR